MNDQVLWQKIKRGDESAFRQLFYDHYRLLVSIAMRYVNDPAQAKDLVQDVLLKMWERRKTIEVKQTLKAYLSQAIRNTCLNHLKSQKMLNHLDEHFEVADASANAVDLMAGDELQEKINQAIEALPTACRTIFLLRRMEGMSLKDIAGQLEISPKTVENQITKARKIMARHLQTYLSVLLGLCVGDWSALIVSLIEC